MTTNYADILKEITAQGATLVAVSKTKPVEAILELYHMGQRDFGENKVQELCEKQAQLPKDIRWHLIGHLQSNKVKYIAPFTHLIHSVDSPKLMHELEKEAAKNQRQLDVLLQIHIAEEESKFGLNEKELIDLLEFYTASPSPWPHLRIRGLMGMATNTDHVEKRRQEFQRLRQLFIFSKQGYLPHRDDFSELSMGMSDDYHLALQEGSTMVRIGSLLFGSR